MQLTRKGYLVTSYLVPCRIGQCESQEHLQTNLHAVRRQNKGPPAAMRYQHPRTPDKDRPAQAQPGPKGTAQTLWDRG